MALENRLARRLAAGQITADQVNERIAERDRQREQGQARRDSYELRYLNFIRKNRPDLFAAYVKAHSNG